MPLPKLYVCCVVHTQPKQVPKTGSPEQIKARLRGRGIIKRNVQGFIGQYFIVEHRLHEGKLLVEAIYHHSELL